MVKRIQPVSKNQKIDISIDGISHDGSGVGRIEGFTVFVPGTTPGDKVSATVISVQKSHARALPLTINEPSASRIDAPCRYFQSCGGCQMQHIAYEEQLKHKGNLVAQSLLRIGNIKSEIKPVIGMDNPWNYRNKAQVPVFFDGKNVITGFFERRSHKVVDIDNCLIQHESNNHAINKTREAIDELKIPVYDEKTHRGIVRHIISRTSLKKGKTVLTIVTFENKIPNKVKLIENLRSNIKNLSGIVQNVNREKSNVILGKEENILYGNPFITEKINDFTFRISPRSFFQVNTTQTKVLYDIIKDFAGLTGEEIVYDLYCGIGSIGIYLSEKARVIVGIDSEKSAIRDAEFNAEKNNVKNASFYTGKAEKIMPALIKNGDSADLVIVDPPRKGCQKELLETIINAGPPKIIYVSCNPATLSRDLLHLKSCNYNVTAVQPVDMFPQTSHVECVVLLERTLKTSF